MSELKLNYLHFWRPDWCPFKTKCWPKVSSINNDLCFGSYSSFRMCINFNFESFKYFISKHDPDKSAVAFLSLTRTELEQFNEMNESTLKYSREEDTVIKVITHEKFRKIESKQIAVT